MDDESEPMHARWTMAILKHGGQNRRIDGPALCAIMDDNRTSPMTDRLAYRVPEVCKMLGISRATFYRRVTSGELSVKKLGGVSLVTRESLERMVGELREGVS